MTAPAPGRMARPPAATLVTVAAVIVTVVALATTAVVLVTGRSGPPPAPAAPLRPGVPVGWPPEVPLIEPSQVVSGNRIDSVDGPFLGVTLRVGDVRGAYRFYRDALAATGHALIEDSPHETAFAFYANLFAVGDTRAVNVVVDGQAGTVTVAISPRAGSPRAG